MAMISFKGSSSSHELVIEDEDYIDMEITTSSSSSSSKPETSQQQNHANKEFEFQMSSSIPSSTTFKDTQITTTTPYFPADELFYNGKLLPLHLPPRLQMLQNILQTSSKLTAIETPQQQPEEEEEADSDSEEETFTIPFMSINTAPCTTTHTPIDQSRNISPSESRRVSCEFLSDGHEDYLSEDQYWSSSTQVRSGSTVSSKKSLSKSLWSNKLKQSTFGKKLVKASRAYLKSLFLQKPGSTTATTKATTQTCDVGREEGSAPVSQTRVANSDSKKMVSATSLMKSIESEIMAESVATHRKSFSGVIQRHNNNNNNKSFLSNSTSSSVSSSSCSSSSSFSVSSNGTSSYDLQWLKRCSSASLELESSIEGAIAHCKQSSISQQLFSSRAKSSTTSQVGHLSNFPLSASRIAV